MDYSFAARERASMRFDGAPMSHTSPGCSVSAAGGMLPTHAESEIAMELAERALLDSYCAELERVLAGSTDELVFYERAAALDQNCLEGLFAQRFGAAAADPLQALRQPPMPGIVHPAAMPSLATASPLAGGAGTVLGARGVEMMRRHAAFLDERNGSAGSALGLGSAGAHPPARFLATGTAAAAATWAAPPSPRWRSREQPSSPSGSAHFGHVPSRLPRGENAHVRFRDANLDSMHLIDQDLPARAHLSRGRDEFSGAHALTGVDAVATAYGAFGGTFSGGTSGRGLSPAGMRARA